MPVILRKHLSWVGLVFVAGCAAPPSPPLSPGHIQPTPPVVGKPLDFATAPALPRPPRPMPRQELYSVSMQNVSVQDMLFALARDANLNVDIHPAIQGTVTMNVRDQTLIEILDRVARQVDLRYEMQGKNLSITPDIPYLKNYRIDYPNISREGNTAVSFSTSLGGSGGSSSGSSSEIKNTSNNRFWQTLVENIGALLRETDKVLPTTGASASPTGAATTSLPAAPVAAPAAAAQTTPSTGGTVTPASTAPAATVQYREAASVIPNPETGIISVRAKQSQHAKVAEFLDNVMRAARRQVLIEATIVEVDLSTRFQQGIDWSLLRAGGAAGDPGIVIRPVGSGLQTGGVVSSLITLTRRDSNFFDGRDLSVMLSMLESFGNLRVLSSPKISVLNNQSSILKVVENKVFFSVSVTPGTAATANTPATPPTYTTTDRTIPIGFLMTVTPQISEGSEVTLNLRPTISRITGYVADPNPILSQNNVVNRVPEVQTREMESVLRVRSGGVAVLGGLMQDSRNNNSDEVPGLNRLPGLGNLFKFRDEGSKKTELVIFLRPTVIDDSTMNEWNSQYQSTLQQTMDDMADKPSSTAFEPTRWLNKP